MRGENPGIGRRPYRKAHKTFPPGTWVTLTFARWARGVVVKTTLHDDGVYHQAHFEDAGNWWTDTYRDDCLVRLRPWPALEARYLEWLLRRD